MANIILISGTWHGGWVWDSIATNLRAQGHTVFAPSLIGLDPNVEANYPINLDTHINDVLAIIDANGLQDLVLVGHSYGGMVITGVADRTTAKVKHLLYLDAVCPRPGESEWNYVMDHDKPVWLASCKDGLNIPVPEPFASEPRTRPHPLATKLQPLHYNQAKFESLKKTYVHAEKWFHVEGMEHAFKPVFDRVKSEPNWSALSWPFGHLLTEEAPDQVEALIVAVSA